MTERISIRDLPDVLLSRGIHNATTRQIENFTGLTAHDVHEGMARLRAAGKAFSPAKGLYVLIPPQFRSWGSVPAMDFIDPMMKVLDRCYYVALLSAAEIHGAAHQRPQAFQVMVDRYVPNRILGRAHLQFYINKHVDDTDVVKKNSSTGTFRVASPETTALDLATRPGESGGLSNVATVLRELADGVGLNPEQIVASANHYPMATIRRLGWLLEHVEAPVDFTRLENFVVLSGRKRASVLLDPSGKRTGSASRRWGLVENVDVEPDL